jgi:predicted metal-dependent hydrolase
MPAPPNPPRYTSRPLPAYSYVPGQHPHPIRDPAGHSYGHAPQVAEPLEEATWRSNQAWLWAIDLFNHDFYWEAHEAWESLWHAAGRRGELADFLKGLIKLAAAGVKHREGRAGGVRLHARRAEELLAPFRCQTRFGLDIEPLVAAAQHMARSEPPAWQPPQLRLEF